ncbi:MAG: iron-containing alcohol dehydrogenase [Planctomycetia bacterium]|nr:iron-containing alcohol dehydrogenase [Planctomycetia bacterium]
MLASYDFFAPNRIIFGWGRRIEIGAIARSLGTRAFLVSGSRTLDSNGTIDELCRSLESAGVIVERLATQTREPEVADVDTTVARLREIGVQDGDLVIAIGGGSAIDLAKAVAALATNPHGLSVRDFLEGVGRGLKIEQPPLPLLAIPTTSGTGTEATKNAVISSYDPPFKKSLRSDLMVPKVVLVDPELTLSLPRETTAHTGMDAITQLIESLISRRAKPIPRALCWQGLEIALPAMFELSRDLGHQAAREAMSHAALLSGVALANSGLGFAHGVAAALGVQAKVPHGLACAVMLPAALELNLGVALPDLAELGRKSIHWLRHERDLLTLNITANDETAARHFIAVIRTLTKKLDIPQQLEKLGVKRDQLPPLVRGSRGNSMDGNPCDVGDEELLAILQKMF